MAPFRLVATDYHSQYGPFRTHPSLGPRFFPQSPTPEMAAMKTTSITLAILLSTLSLMSCDDEESGSNLPPDLRMEDVVGCWWWSVEDYCQIMCYDASMSKWYQTYDSATKRIYENVGVYSLSGYRTSEHVTSRSTSSRVDTVDMTTPLRRVGGYLYVLNDQYQLAERFVPVADLDSLPCGTPFALLPKPANWTLF